MRIVSCSNTDRSSEVSNVIAVEPLLLYNSNGSSGSCSYYCESSKAVCYDDNNRSMIEWRKCLQRWKRVGRHAAQPRISREVADEGAILPTCTRATKTSEIVQ